MLFTNAIFIGNKLYMMTRSLLILQKFLTQNTRQHQTSSSRVRCTLSSKFNTHCLCVERGKKTNITNIKILLEEEYIVYFYLPDKYIYIKGICRILVYGLSFFCLYSLATRYDNITLIPLVLHLGLRIDPIQRMGAVPGVIHTGRFFVLIPL